MIKTTENGSIAFDRTNSKVLDLFAFGGAYRNRTKEEKIKLFEEAYEESRTFAIKVLFYLRDVRGGQGERQFFRDCYSWLIEKDPATAIRCLEFIPFFGRYDDLIYIAYGTPVEGSAAEIIKNTLTADMNTESCSLLGKWLPSINASSQTTRDYANKVRKSLGLNCKDYRKLCSKLRKKINVLERLMSARDWTAIEFDKIPSKAGLKYRHAFMKNELIGAAYKEFMSDKNTKVNAKTLYPYEIVEKCDNYGSDFDPVILEKYWNALPDYFDGKPSNILCMVDTSGSMGGRPEDVAISLGIYCAERCKGLFHNNYITFSAEPQLMTIGGSDIVRKVRDVHSKMINSNTNLEAAFDMLLEVACKNEISQSEMPDTIVVISDMEIDAATSVGVWNWRKADVMTDVRKWTQDSAATMMEEMREKWNSAGYKLPKLVYWNVQARNNTILDRGPDVSFVSGCSPVIFKQVITGKTGYDLMLETISVDRYNILDCFG